MKQEQNLTQALTPEERRRLAFRNLQAAAHQLEGETPLPVEQPKDSTPQPNTAPSTPSSPEPPQAPPDNRLYRTEEERQEVLRRLEAEILRERERRASYGPDYLD